MEEYEKTITCPYCWQDFIIFIEPDLQKAESYIEDCYVCCRPISITLMHKDEFHVNVEIQRVEGNEF